MFTRNQEGRTAVETAGPLDVVKVSVCCRRIERAVVYAVNAALQTATPADINATNTAALMSPHCSCLRRIIPDVAALVSPWSECKPPRPLASVPKRRHSGRCPGTQGPGIVA